MKTLFFLVLFFSVCSAGFTFGSSELETFNAGGKTCTEVMNSLFNKMKHLQNKYNFALHEDKTAILARAAEIDYNRTHGLFVGSFACVPFTAKDNMDVVGYPTTAGTPGLTNPLNVPSADADVVAFLLAESAVPFYKTNLDEMFGDTTGMNFFTGFINNPIGQSRISGGSSAGAAVVSQLSEDRPQLHNLPSISFCTDTGGSCRIPASFTGTFGFRTNSSDSMDDGWPAGGVIRVSSTMDRVGGISARMDTIVETHKLITGNSDDILPADLSALRLGYDANEFSALLDPETRSVFDQALMTMQNSGVTIVPVDMAGIMADSETANFIVGPYEGNETLREYLEPAGYNLDTVVQQIVTPSVQFLYGQLILGPLRPTFADYQFGLALRSSIIALLDETMDNHTLDGFVLPTTIVPALLQEDVGQVIVVDGQIVPTFQALSKNTNLASASSMAALNVPVGVTSAGLPVGAELTTFENRKVLSMGLSMKTIF